MSQEFKFEEKEPFLQKLQELLSKGYSFRELAVFTPFPVHEVEELLNPPPSPLRFFTLLGALSGLLFGLILTVWTSLDYPLIGGGKPIVALPAFIIIMFEMTILFGGVISFLGFLMLSRFPAIEQFVNPVEYGNDFVIQIHGEEQK